MIILLWLAKSHHKLYRCCTKPHGFTLTGSLVYILLQESSVPINVLYLGEIIGKPGIFCLKSRLASLKKELEIDFTISNADGTTNGFGIGKNHAMYVRKLGVDVLCGGDQIFFKKDMVPMFDSFYHMLRPANLPPTAPGRGWKYFNVGERKIAVINMLGMHGFSRIHVSNPFSFLPEIIKRIQAETPFIILDFHTVTTAEKSAMNLFADGKVSAVFGSGLRTLTADAEILPMGTAVIGDCGRTGSAQSVIGFEPEHEIHQYLTAMPQRSMECWNGLEIQGCVVTLGDDGKATAIKSLRIPVTEKPHDKNGNDNEDSE